MKLIEQIAEVLRESSKPMHVDDIAIFLVEKYPNIQISLDMLPGKISAVLSSDIKRKKSKSIFAKPKNKQGGFKRGIYKIKAPRKKKVSLHSVPEQPKVPTSYTGKAGENAVLSELLFFGFNASIMSVDDGIDLVASKKNNYFHIQVKTANSSAAGKYSFTLQLKSFDAKDTYSTFYILVLRNFESGRYYNDYLVLPNHEVKRLVESSVIKKADKMSFRVERDRAGQYILNSIENVNWTLNRFDLIN